MAENLLSEKTVRATKPLPKPYKMGDGKGMYLLVQPNGTKCWRLKYRFEGKEKLLALGVFDDVGLALARDRRDEARKLIARGIDPVRAKRSERAAKNDRARYTFEKAAAVFITHNTKAWSESHRRDVDRIVAEINATLGDKSMAAIEPEDVERVIEKIEKRGALTYARDVRMYFRAIVRHFNAKNRKHRIADPSADILISRAPRVKHHAALDPSEIGGFLRTLRNSNAAPLVRLAVRLLVATGVRTTELRLARWSEIDTKAKLWRIPAERMKAHREHLVPLAPQVLEVLAELRQTTGKCDLLFPHLFEPDQPISEGTIINAIKYGCGYKGRATGHGMRRTFSTWANEQGFHPDAIERQLAHVEHNAVRAAYNAAEHLPERKRLMAAWAIYLDESERSAKVSSNPPSTHMKHERKPPKSEAGQRRPAKSMSARRKPHDWTAMLNAIEADARSHPELNFDEQYVHAIQRALDGRDPRLLLELLDRGTVSAAGSWLIHPSLGPVLADVIRSQRDGAVGYGAKLTAYQDRIVRQYFDMMDKFGNQGRREICDSLATMLRVSAATIDRSLRRTRNASK